MGFTIMMQCYALSRSLAIVMEAVPLAATTSTETKQRDELTVERVLSKVWRAFPEAEGLSDPFAYDIDREYASSIRQRSQR
ncbi:hypothetical protein K440DRAFT_365351 [Wilcoxina mikolae CBS 423.85]|nr:hypothetical protein K440DRAFT_365351 [Wilcoxina mikolae CBS 423.85]